MYAVFLNWRYKHLVYFHVTFNYFSIKWLLLCCDIENPITYCIVNLKLLSENKTKLKSFVVKYWTSFTILNWFWNPLFFFTDINIKISLNRTTSPRQPKREIIRMSGDTFLEKNHKAMLKIKDCWSLISLVFSFTPNYNNLLVVQVFGECNSTKVN